MFVVKCVCSMLFFTCVWIACQPSQPRWSRVATLNRECPHLRGLDSCRHLRLPRTHFRLEIRLAMHVVGGQRDEDLSTVVHPDCLNREKW